MDQVEDPADVAPDAPLPEPLHVEAVEGVPFCGVGDEPGLAAHHPSDLQPPLVVGPDLLIHERVEVLDRHHLGHVPPVVVAGLELVPPLRRARVELHERAEGLASTQTLQHPLHRKPSAKPWSRVISAV
ncbi:MAG: hypothetical protein KC656_22630 [Myxococcales bacterium]|nr:hypothetical protein [Myxococcales bacterium]